MITGALIAALALAAAIMVFAFWQAKRASYAMDALLAKSSVYAELRILLAASEVALADKDRALNIVTAERDRLEFAVQTVEEQRDALLQEALEHATPGTIAISVRDALKRLRVLDPKEAPEPEALPDVPGGADDNGS